MTNATNYRSSGQVPEVQAIYNDETGIEIGRNVMIMHDQSLDSGSGETYTLENSRSNSPAPLHRLENKKFS